MMILTHILSGALLGLILFKNQEAAAYCLLGSILPDLDAVLGMGVHRKLLHNVFFVAALWYFGNIYLAVGTLLHILLDSLTKAGVAVFFPFSSKRYGLRITKNRGLLDYFTALVSLILLIHAVVSVYSTPQQLRVEWRSDTSIVLYVGSEREIFYSQCRKVFLVYRDKVVELKRYGTYTYPLPEKIVLWAYYSMCRPCFYTGARIHVYELRNNHYERVYTRVIGGKYPPTIKKENGYWVLHYKYYYSDREETYTLLPCKTPIATTETTQNQSTAEVVSSSTELPVSDLILFFMALALFLITLIDYVQSKM